MEPRHPCLQRRAFQRRPPATVLDDCRFASSYTPARCRRSSALINLRHEFAEAHPVPPRLEERRTRSALGSSVDFRFPRFRFLVSRLVWSHTSTLRDRTGEGISGEIVHSRLALGIDLLHGHMLVADVCSHHLRRISTRRRIPVVDLPDRIRWSFPRDFRGDTFELA